MVLLTQSTRKKNKGTSKLQSLDGDNADDEGFIEGDIDTGKVFSTFSFGTDPALSDDKFSATQAPAQVINHKAQITQNQTFASAPRGVTPPVNGEQYTVKRSYTMRPSTVRKLNALKTEHPDVNVLFNTIVDMAISHYYNYIFNEHGTFSNQE